MQQPFTTLFLCSDILYCVVTALMLTKILVPSNQMPCGAFLCRCKLFSVFNQKSALPAYETTYKQKLRTKTFIFVKLYLHVSADK